ncbi:Tetratricopeptide repeat-containing protein [Sinosporangium album]|uniref:Tetratricopeptide repeat-containing protein n=1 Tax=Sinosporangium album TaxID=504805 RepID=A0A1G8LKE5_9ACTN|nr:NB-ARC domain-containing protein [Sinosporangium album]SDI56182.1 Tetratricopeptide repeat-containing protein [Sinosporangium album]
MESFLHDSTVGSMVQAGIVHGGIHLHSASARPIPRQLPGSTRAFANRRRELTLLDQVLAAANEAAPDLRAPAIVVIHGPGGAGKTSLALAWLTRLQGGYGDGHLYADLRGYAPGRKPSPGEVMHRFLSALGVPAGQVPANLEEQTALYRTLTADQRLIVMLDDVDSLRLLRRVAPASSGALVVATTRVALPPLHLPDAQLLPVAALQREESLVVLEHLLGSERVRSEHDAAARLADVCGGLPLALAACAAYLRGRRWITVGRLADDLANDISRRLTMTNAGDDEAASAAASVFDASYRALLSGVQRAYRILGALSGPRFTVGAVAAALESSEQEAEQLLDSLAAASLLERRDDGRYTFHALVAEHARTTGERLDLARDRREGFRRFCDWYLDLAAAGDVEAMPDRLRLDRRYHSVRRGVFSGAAEALDWQEEHLEELTCAQAKALQLGLHEHVVVFPEVLRSLFLHRRHSAVWDAVTAAGVASARVLTEPRLLGRMLLARASYLTHARDHTGATSALREAVMHARLGDDLPGEAAARETMGIVFLKRGDLGRAEDAFRKAYRLFEEARLPRGKALVERRLGEVSMMAGEFEEAALRLRGAHDRFTELGDVYNTARTLALTGQALARTDDGRREAARVLEEALQVARDITHLPMQAEIHAELAQIADKDGSKEEAAAHLRRAAELYEELHQAPRA